MMPYLQTACSFPDDIISAMSTLVRVCCLGHATRVCMFYQTPSETKIHELK